MDPEIKYAIVTVISNRVASARNTGWLKTGHTAGLNVKH